MKKSDKANEIIPFAHMKICVFGMVVLVMCFGRKLAATLLMDTALYVLDLKKNLKTFMVLPKI